MKNKGWIHISGVLIMVLLQSCIYDYPKGTGNDPSTVDVGVELFFDLTWEEFTYSVDFSTKAGAEKPHRFIFEVSSNGQVICREEERISDIEFATGSMRYRFNRALPPQVCDIAVWYEGTVNKDEEEGVLFNSEEFNRVKIKSQKTHQSSNTRCGYSSDQIDLSNYSGKLHASEVKQLKLHHAGARFELIATDIKQFIADQRENMLQGDSFTVHVAVGDATFNTYSGSVSRTGEDVEYVGDLWMPFADYDELKIAEGFLFCNQDEYVSMTLLVYNSAHVIVTRSPKFTIPVKRGYITVVKGELLSFPINGSLSVDHIWEGEHIFEI